MTTILRIAAGIGLALLAACDGVTREQITQLKPNQTTYDQVIETFGPPTSELNLSGGSKVALYNQPEYDRDVTQVTPWVNLFFSDYSRKPYDFFVFNKDGVLESFSIPHFAREAGVDAPES